MTSPPNPYRPPSAPDNERGLTASMCPEHATVHAWMPNLKQTNTA